MWVAAAEASGEAVALRRQLVTSNRNAFLPDLALALHTHSLSLQKINRPAEALKMSHEAVALRRELAGLNPDAHLPELAKTLNNHALRLAETGRTVAAFEASRESIAIRRGLVARHGDVYLPALATSLWHSGLVALTTGNIGNEVVAQTTEGVHYLTALAINEPAAFGGRQQAAANVLARLRRRTST
jgi:hypothetical protein